MNDKYEIRSFSGSASPKLSNERTISGYAVVFGVESVVMYDPMTRRRFIEVIEPGAVTEEMLRKCDIKALLEHNRQRMIARSYNGEGSLTLSVDEKGVMYRFDAPNTPDGEYAVEMIKRGDLFGSSFAYLTDEKKNVSYKMRSDGILHRSVKVVDRMFDISVVSDPAYMDTSVEVRSLDGYYEHNDESYKLDIEQLRNLTK